LRRDLFVIIFVNNFNIVSILSKKAIILT